jgi:hypothetical protein
MNSSIQLPRITLYSGPLSMFGAKAQIAALEKGLDFDLVMVSYDSKSGYSPKHPDVLRINPKGTSRMKFDCYCAITILLWTERTPSVSLATLEAMSLAS